MKLSKPQIWIADKLEQAGQHSFGTYIMSSGNEIYRVGALGINTKMKAAQGSNSPNLRTITNRIREARHGITKHLGNWSLLFFAGMNADWYPFLERAEIFMQGEMYRSFTYVGTSHFQANNSGDVVKKAVSAINLLYSDLTLLNRVKVHGRKQGQSYEIILPEVY